MMVKNRSCVRKIKDYIFSTFAFPLAFDVALMFWSLFAFDRETVAPKEWDPIFPVWLNHFIHTDIIVFISIELIILHRHYLDIIQKQYQAFLDYLSSCFLTFVGFTSSISKPINGYIRFYRTSIGLKELDFTCSTFQYPLHFIFLENLSTT